MTSTSNATSKCSKTCGLVLIGQTAEIAPADKRLYALRDATATVESIPLISASIMSKKLAEGIDGLVLDVKTGGGAFMERLDDARTLAESMCMIGRALGKRMRALITRMDQPLGRTVGNAVEVAECIACLKGETGAETADLLDLSIELAAEMVVMGERAASIDDARALCRRTIDDGTALERFRRLVDAQGGDVRAIDDPGSISPTRTAGTSFALIVPACCTPWPPGRSARRPCSWARAGHGLIRRLIQPSGSSCTGRPAMPLPLAIPSAPS